MDALREIVTNMIVHRDYSNSSDSIVKIFDDRIEFYNPGKLPGGLTVPELLRNEHLSSLRNKQVGNIFKEAGIMEKYGSGIKRILSLFKEMRLPRPEFKEFMSGFHVVVLNGKTTQKTTQKGTQKTTQKKSLRDKILAVVEKNPHVTRSGLAYEIAVSENTIKEYLTKLKTEGRLERIGPDKGGYWKVSKK